MRKLYYMRLLVCMATLLVMAGMLLQSCKDDSNEVNSGKVELLSFGPAGVKLGEQISFIGKNLDKVTEIQLPGATVQKSQFVKQTADMIVLTVPMETGKGLVTLKAPEGDVVSKTEIQFNVTVAITSVPASAQAGQNITITGDYLNWVTGVQFATATDDTLVTEFVSQSLNQLVVHIPSTAVTGPVVFYTGGTEPKTIESEENLIITGANGYSPALNGLNWPVYVNLNNALHKTGTLKTCVNTFSVLKKHLILISENRKRKTCTGTYFEVI